MDLDLGVPFVEFFFVLPLFSPISISCFWWDLGVKDLSTSCVLSIAFGASVCALYEDLWKLKVCELVTLGSLDSRRLLWWLKPFMVTWEPPILLWVEPQDCCKGSGFRLEGFR